MRLAVIFTSTLYSVFQAFAGLLLHPYQTMQYLVEEKIFLWLAFAPSVLLVFVTLLWWGGLKFFFTSIPFIGLWAFGLIWTSLFLGLWQLLLLYLMIRFWISLR